MTRATLDIGTRISERYEVREVLGYGTLGPAYKVFDHARSRPAVLKLLPEQFRRKNVLAKRFIKHYRDLQGLDHPGLAKILDVAVHDGAPFVVSEFLEGLSLRQLIEARRAEGGPFAVDEVESVLEEVAQVLSFLHQTGYHGALKPENVFLLPDRIKLTDEGLMEVLPVEVFARVQVKHETAAPFLAPEILSDPEHVSKEVDVFGVAAIAYTMLAGKPPTVPPDPLANVREDLPEKLDAVLARGLNDEPHYRQPSVNTFLLEMARAMGDENKIRTLEQVVDAEAQEAAERAAKQAIAESSEAAAAAGPDEAPAEPPETEAPPPPAPSEADVASLFDDEDAVSEARPPGGEAGDGASAPVEGGGSGETGEDTDLLTPTPAISDGNGGGKAPLWIGLLVVVVAAAAGGGYWFTQMRKGGEPDQQADAVTVDDPRLRKAVTQVIQATETVQQEILRHGESIAENPSYEQAAETLEAAKQALATGDTGAALDHAQAAEKQFAGLLDLLNLSAEQTAQAQAKAQAAAEAAATARERAAAKPAPAPKPDPKPAPEPEPEPEPAAKPAPPPKPKPEPEPKQAAQSGSASGAAAPARKECPSDMVEIPAGPFQAGSPPDDFLRDATERPLAKLNTDAYCIDRYEFPNKKGSRPKTNIGRDEAAALCEAQGKQLCSEVQWEKACKGPRGNDYPYGKVWDPNACITETATGEDRSVKPAGSMQSCRSDYGVYDLSGNVMEWTATEFAPNPDLTIVKGGSYLRPDYAARCAYRYTTPDNTKDAEIGFRCCAELP